MKHVPYLALLIPWTLSADAISVGFRGGVPLSDAFSTSTSNLIRYRSIPKRYTFGPTFQIHLPAGLGITFDALYRKASYEEQTGSGAAVERSGTRWDFPLMGRYHFGKANVKPFVAAGYSFHRLSPSLVSDPKAFVRKTDKGIVFGAGLELKGAGFRLMPEFRYTRHDGDSFRQAAGSLIRANPNQIDFLVGLTF